MLYPLSYLPSYNFWRNAEVVLKCSGGLDLNQRHIVPYEVSEFPVTLTLNLKNWRWSCWSSYVLTHRSVIRTRTVLYVPQTYALPIKLLRSKKVPSHTPQFKLIKNNINVTVGQRYFDKFIRNEWADYPPLKNSEHTRWRRYPCLDKEEIIEWTPLPR